MSAGQRAATRLFAGAGLAWGLALQFAAEPVVDAVCPELPAGRRWVVRLLGARLVAQHATLLVAPRPPLLPAVAGVEGLHAVSMLPLLGLPRYRRAALISGGVAAVSAAVLAALTPASERG